MHAATIVSCRDRCDRTDAIVKLIVAHEARVEETWKRSPIEAEWHSEHVRLKPNALIASHEIRIIDAESFAAEHERLSVLRIRDLINRQINDDGERWRDPCVTADYECARHHAGVCLRVARLRHLRLDAEIDDGPVPVIEGCKHVGDV